MDKNRWPDTAVLVAQGIVKKYGSKKVVDHISFHVNRGEIFGLLGPNGAGKTTTIRMIMNILAPDDGNIRYSFTEKFQKRVGYLPEDRGIYQTSKVLETIVYFGQLKGMKRENVVKSAMEWLDKLELKDYAYQKIESLSKGMQQKIQFIISIIHHPEFVVLDEVFAGLDPVNQDLFKEIIRSLSTAGITVLLSSHRMNLVEELCDKILVINRGKQIIYGSLSKIKEDFNQEKVKITYRGNAKFFKNHPDLLDLKERGGQVEFYLASKSTPNRFIREIPTDVQITEMSIVKPPLHDIFVRTIKAGDQHE